MELFLLTAWIVAISEFSERNAKTKEDVALTTLFKMWRGVSRVVPKNLNLWRDPLSQTGKYLKGHSQPHLCLWLHVRASLAIIFYLEDVRKTDNRTHFPEHNLK